MYIYMTTKEEIIDLEPMVLRARDEFTKHYSLGDIEQKAPVDLHKLRMIGIRYHIGLKKYKDEPQGIKLIEEDATMAIVDLLRETQLEDMFNTNVGISPSA